MSVEGMPVHELAKHVRVSKDQNIQFFVKAGAGESLTFSLPSNTDVSQLKGLISQRRNISAEEVQLLFNKRLLDDDLTLSSYGVEDESTLFLTEGRLRGGCFSFCASCCSSCAGGALGEMCIVKSNSTSRGPYLVIMFLAVIISLLLRYYLEPLNIDLYVYSTDACDATKCVGTMAVYRVSFMLALFHGAIYLSMLSGSARAHTHYWCFKIFYLLTFFFVLLFLVPNDVFDVYAHIARFVSGLFLLIQIIILIDFAFTWSEAWNNEERYLPIPSLIVGLIFYGFCLTIFVFSLDWFTASEGGDCHRNKGFIASTFIFTFIFSLLSFLNRVQENIEGASILSSSVVSAYCYYLLYSALASDPSQCNTLHPDNWWQIVIGILLAAISITYAAWQVSNARRLFALSEEEVQRMEEQQKSAEVELEEKGQDLEKSSKDEDEDVENVSEEWVAHTRKFHFVMMSGSMYLAMLITNWGSEGLGSEAKADLGEATVWIKIVTMWLTALLYTWTLTAPILLPDRDW